MTKNKSLKKNLKTDTLNFTSRTNKDVLRDISSVVDYLILNNVVIWEKPTEWFWEFVKTLEPSIQLPLSPEVATKDRGTRLAINGRNRPRRGEEVPNVDRFTCSEAYCPLKNTLCFVATRRAEVATGSYPGKEGDSLPAGTGPVVTGHTQERNL